MYYFFLLMTKKNYKIIFKNVMKSNILRDQNSFSFLNIIKILINYITFTKYETSEQNTIL